MCTHTATAPLPQVTSTPQVIRPQPVVVAPARVLTLKDHESLRIVDARGRALLDIFSSDRGPVLRLAENDADLEVEGKLRIQAAAIEMIAHDGELKMLAKDDVVVRGEKVRLN